MLRTRGRGRWARRQADKIDRFLGIGDLQRGQHDKIADFCHPVDVQFFPGIGGSVVVIMNARKEMKHGNFLAVKGHVVAASNVVGFADFEAQLLSSCQHLFAKIAARARAKHGYTVVAQAPDHI